MSENPKFEEQKERATKILMTMFDYLGLEASLRVEEKGSRIAIKIMSEDAGRIIGRKGQTLESLQLLLNRIMFRNEEDCPRLTLDIDGYARGNVRGRREDGEEGGEEREERPARRERSRNSDRGGDRDNGGRDFSRDNGDRDNGGRDFSRDNGDRDNGGRDFSRDNGDRSNGRDGGYRDNGGRDRRPRRNEGESFGGAPEPLTEEQLQLQAQDAAKEVKRWGEPVTLPKMNAHDRRIIHVTLQDDAEIATQSEGEGALKNVIISLKKD
jgi:predicted RNA-binding protein Jag